MKTLKSRKFGRDVSLPKNIQWLLFSSSRRSLKMKLTPAHTLATFSQRAGTLQRLPFLTFLSMLKAMHQVLLAIEHQPISS